MMCVRQGCKRKAKFTHATNKNVVFCRRHTVIHQRTYGEKAGRFIPIPKVTA